jgi:hypothetical protein
MNREIEMPQDIRKLTEAELRKVIGGVRNQSPISRMDESCDCTERELWPDWPDWDAKP